MKWHAFDFGAYGTDTARLSCDGHGAYIQLITDYYNTKSPMPDDDEQLATLVKLSPERWKVVRKSLERFFRIEGGYWFHDRIEHEIKEACDKHAAGIERARHAAEVRHGRASPKDAPSIPRANPKPSKSKKTAPSMPVASSEHAGTLPQASPKLADLDSHITLSSESVNARAQGDEIDSKAKEDFNPLGTVLPVDWVPDDEDVSVALGYGMDNPIIHEQLLIFHALNAQKGTFSKNWKGTWRIFCSRWKDLRKPAPPPPRVEVNTAPLTASYERAAELWARGGASTWSHQLGPEPGQIGCRCPAEILTNHKIDPKTGLVAAPSKEPVS